MSNKCLIKYSNVLIFFKFFEKVNYAVNIYDRLKLLYYYNKNVRV